MIIKIGFNKIFLFLFLAVNLSFAQIINVSGVVVDDKGPLSGASVLIEDSQDKGVVTDINGKYEISVEKGEVLVFRFIGMKDERVVVESGIINVIMSVSTELLENIVVVGYGKQSITKVSGAISSVDKKSIEVLDPVRVEDALQGNSTGVSVISRGEPGAKPTLLVRGITSNRGNDAIVVIDGVTQTLDDLNALNTSDIESMSVLKDASTTAIYGVKGANGVIVINTKRGKKGQKPVLSYTGSYGVQQVSKFIPVLNASEYASILNEASVNSGEGIIFKNIKDLGRGTDWQKEVFKNSEMHSHNVSMSGGNNYMGYFVSTGIRTHEGVIGGGNKSFSDLITFTGNFDIDVMKDLKIISNTSYSNIKSSRLGDVLFDVLNFDPTVPIRDKEGEYSVSDNITQEVANPFAKIDNSYNINRVNKLFGKVEIQYDIIKNLKVSNRLGYTYADIKGKTFVPLVYYGSSHNQTTANKDLTPIVTTNDDGQSVSTHNRVTENRTNYYNLNYEIFANYKFNLFDKNNFDLVAGWSISKNVGDHIEATAEDIPYNSWDYADVSSAKGDKSSQAVGSWQYVNRNLSYFARINYDYDDRYLASFVARRDGSTSFGKNNKFGFFPSGSIGWIVSKEEFFDLPLINFLKLRGSYGLTGSDNVSFEFSKISNNSKYVLNGNVVSGSALETIPNDDISWEKQLQLNVGFDVKFIDKINISLDYYNKNVSDLLFNPELSLYLGTPKYPMSNIGTMETSGLDISLNYREYFSDNFEFSTTVNFATMNSKVISINNGDKFVWLSSYGIPSKNLQRFEVGKAPGYFFGHKTDGIFQNQDDINKHAKQDNAVPGDIRFVDINEDGKIDDNDRTEIGNPYADYIVSWNISINFHDFDLSIFTHSSIGNDIYRAYERNLNYTNRFSSVLNRWRGEGTSNKESRVTFKDENNNTRVSDRYIEDGSFIKVKNIQFGYVLPSDMVSEIKLKSMRIYFQVKNAITLTKYSGYDPEISGSIFDTGIDRGYYPIPRIWLFGVQLKL